MDVAVAVNAYNRANVLSETLDSILSQTSPPRRLCVIDDQSKDATPAVLARYGDRIIWKTIANVGCGAARKAAIELCNDTQWIAFCDSDDLWLPTHLAAFDSLLARWPDADLLVANHTTFGPNEPVGYDYFAARPASWWQRVSIEEDGTQGRFAEDAYQSFLDFNPSVPSTLAVRRAAYEAIGGIDPAWSRSQAEDTDLTRRLVAAGAVVCYDKAITVRLRRDGTNMSRDQPGNLLGRAKIVEAHLRRSIVPEDYRSDASRFVSSSLEEALRRAFNADVDETAHEAARRLRGYPTTTSTKLRRMLLRLPKPVRNLARR